MSIMVFFVLTQLSDVRRKRKEQEDELTTEKKKLEESKRIVSLFDELVFTTVMLTSLLIEFESFWKS